MNLNFVSAKALPSSVPYDLEPWIKVVAAAPNQTQALEVAYRLLSGKYRGFRGRTYTRLIELFRDDLSVIWKREGFLHCTNLNFLLTVLLVRSGHFTAADIKLKWTHIYFLAPHQYARVRVGDHWRNVDIWSAAYGIELGDHSHSLHSGRLY